MKEFPLLIIPTFNNPTYLRLMLSQIQSMGWSNFIVIDSGSTFPAMQDELDKLPKSKKLILGSNLGPRFFSENNEFFLKLPNIFCVSDPDLKFNGNMPEDFIELLTEVSSHYRIGKVGLALDISKELNLKEQNYILEGKLQNIREYEKQYWTRPVPNSLGLELYDAPVDTTFALYNKRFFEPNKSFTRAYRIAGAYSAVHLPWLDFESRPSDEIDFYNSLNKSGAFHEIDGMHLRLLQEIEDLKASVSWRITRPLRGLIRITKKCTQSFPTFSRNGR